MHIPDNLRIVQTPLLRADSGRQSFFLQFGAGGAIQNNNIISQIIFNFTTFCQKNTPELHMFL
jgi:hypothetical protein